MVTLQILVLSFLVRIRVSQQNEHLSNLEDAFFMRIMKREKKKRVWSEPYPLCFYYGD